MKLLVKTIIGKWKVSNRMVMAPMTRSGADINGVVGDLTVLYYTQRAGAGLIITEGINISEQAFGSPSTPGLYSREQIEAWKKITKAAHDKSGVILCPTLAYRTCCTFHDRKGELPVAPSAVAISGMQHFTSQGLKDFETPKH